MLKEFLWFYWIISEILKQHFEFIKMENQRKPNLYRDTDEDEMKLKNKKLSKQNKMNFHSINYKNN